VDQLTSALKEHARKNGADLVGVTSIERFAGIASQFHPSSIFPEARSVVVIGRRITRGTLRGVEEGTQLGLYNLYGADWLDNRFVALTTFRVAEFLEDNRWEAVPLAPLPSQIPPSGIPVRPGAPAPNVLIDIEQAAVRAGLGEIGYCGVFLSPQFGPRQRFQAIITDAALEPDPLLAAPVCAGCRDLAAICPLGALHSDGETMLDIAGKKMVVARIDYSVCRSCKNGARPSPLHKDAPPDRLAALCTRTCIARLEKDDKLSNKMEAPFRKRAPWAVAVSYEFKEGDIQP
jgi:epoxyqueuosine reductase QueG